MRKFFLFILSTALLAAFSAFAASAVPSTSSAPAVSSTQSAPTAASTTLPPKPALPEVDALTLHKFARAYEGLHRLRAEYDVKIKAVASATQQQAIKREENVAMRQHINQHMPLAEYIKMSKAVSANPNLRRRLIVILKANLEQKADPEQTVSKAQDGG